MFRFISNWFIQEHHSHTFSYVYSCYGVVEGKFSNPELLCFGAGPPYIEHGILSANTETDWGASGYILASLEGTRYHLERTL